MNPDFKNMWAENSPQDSFSPQWAVNASAQYSKIPHDQVDWASLAQQWIKMKEEAPVVKNEPPCETMKEKTSVPLSQNMDWHPPPAMQTSDPAWNSNWGWNLNSGWCWNSPKAPTSPAYPSAPFASAITSLDSPAPAPITAPPIFSYASQVPVQPESYNHNSSYWTGAGAGADAKESWDRSQSKKKEETSVDPLPELDAAKRKQLPAWIREGLEKMEREKQKKAENEKLEKLRHEEMKKNSEVISTGSNGETFIPKKSKFESESDDSGSEDLNNESETKAQQRKSRFDLSVPLSQNKSVYKTKEQILQACMVDVRRILTQILMEVTNEEIRKAVNEAHNKYKIRAPDATLCKTQALSSLTGKLGLGIYGSDSGSESEAEKVTDPDSDQEIRDRIERLKNEFVKVEVQIEREALEQDEREKRQLQIEVVSYDGSPNDEAQVQLMKEGTSMNRTEKYQSDDKSYDSKKERGNETVENPRQKKCTRRSDFSRSRAYNDSSDSSSDNSRSPSPYYKRKHKHHHRSNRYSKSRSRTRSRSRSHERKHKRKSSKHSSSSSKKSQFSRRSRRESSSSSSGERHSRKSNNRR